MKQKSLPLLLVLPFVIGILSVLTIRFAVNLISEDLIDIVWSYRQNEAFKIGTQTKLEAQGEGSKEALKDPLNALVWSIQSEEEENTIAELKVINNEYYLVAHEVGKVGLTVSNVRGSLSRQLNAYIYETGVILVNPATSSGQGIEKTTYIGEYDFGTPSVKKARYPLQVEAVPSSLNKDIVISDIPTGIRYVDNVIIVDQVNSGVEFKELTFSLSSLDIPAQTYSFALVKDGYNVYNYSQLLQATNKTNPRIIVQQKHFESLANTYDSNNKLKREDTTLFGNYNFTTKEYSFTDEVYRFKTTYSTKYINDWNNVSEAKLSNDVIAGLHIQKDFYGNGFKLNGHNLTYPYTTTTNNQGVSMATLTAQNLFRGPLTFVALGNPTQTPLINAYGQDNTFIYVEGNNITLRDVNIRNADFGNNLNNLNYTGTGIDIQGNNVTLINSQVKNARTAVRVFASGETTIKNSFLSTARQFLLSIGSNQSVLPRPDYLGSTYLDNGSLNADNSRFSVYFRYPDTPLTINDLENINSTYADGLITKYLINGGNNQNLEKAMIALDNLINQKHLVMNSEGEPDFKTNVTVEDTYFYQSGIASIAFETMFNGPFLYNGLASIVSSMLQNLIAGVKPKEIGGISYPAKLNLVGDTSFFDYKDINSIDVSSLIGENISTIINDTQYGSGQEYSIDDIFPIRSLVANTANANGFDVNEKVDENMVKYVNIPLIYFGGGVNLSEVDISNLNNKEAFSTKTDLNLLNHLMSAPSSDMLTMVMERSVLMATGFNPFAYHAYTGEYLYNVYPQIEILKQRA